MEVSQNGINLIKEFEGCRLTAYQDSVGVWTIGYGHTSGVYAGMTIGQEQADSFLKSDVEAHARYITTYVTHSLSQNQYDALASFCFNLGAHILKDSTLAAYLNQGNWTLAANEMKAYVNAGGVPLEGLIRRRNAEVTLFLKNDEPINNKGEIEMQAFIKVKGGITWFDGQKRHNLPHIDCVNVLNDIYKKNNGKEMPVLDFTGSAEAWLVRLDQAINA